MKKSARKTEKPSRRNVIVLAGLLGALSLTSVLLLALAPAPLSRDNVRPLFAAEEDDALEIINHPPTLIQPGRWQYIFIHHSRTSGGNAQLTGDVDHFVIGNGEGAEDGEIQMGMRWNRQASAAVPNTDTGDNCISICLVGDFDQTAPSSTQLKQLNRLVKFLQIRYGISARSILSQDAPGDARGIGHFFPRAQFAQHLQQ